MRIYIVTSQANEKNTNGVLERAKVRCFGCFTDQTMADGIALKNNATVTDIVLDQEYVHQDNVVFQTWLNPGYTNG